MGNKGKNIKKNRYLKKIRKLSLIFFLTISLLFFNFSIKINYQGAYFEYDSIKKTQAAVPLLVAIPLGMLGGAVISSTVNDIVYNLATSAGASTDYAKATADTLGGITTAVISYVNPAWGLALAGNTVAQAVIPMSTKEVVKKYVQDKIKGFPKDEVSKFILDIAKQKGIGNTKTEKVAKKLADLIKQNQKETDKNAKEEKPSKEPPTISQKPSPTISQNPSKTIPQSTTPTAPVAPTPAPSYFNQPNPSPSP